MDHVEQVRDRMAQVWPIVRDHLRHAQQAQAWVYNRGDQLRIFRPGDLVLVLVPTAGWGRPWYWPPGATSRWFLWEMWGPDQKQDLDEIILQHRDVFSRDSRENLSRAPRHPDGVSEFDAYPMPG